MNHQDRIYRRLQRHLDRQPVGFPAAWLGADRRFLRRMFRPDEARVALHLSHQPTPTETIVTRTALEFSADQTRQLLEAMFQKGAIGWREKDGLSHWHLLPMVVGMYEAQDGELTPEFVADADPYLKTLAYGSSLLAVSPPQMRTVPVDQSIPTDHAVATYDQIRAIVGESPGPFVVLNCICRQRKALQHQPCRQTSRLETCLTFGGMAAAVRRRRHGRELTRGEAMDLLRQNEDDGLVLQPANARHPEFVCSCCGCCCGMLSLQKSLPHPLDFWTSNFYAEVDSAACSHCGTCVTRCQVNAITLPRTTDTARVNLHRCIGCGLCVSTCPSEAVRLRKKSPEVVPPETAEDLMDQIAARKKGPWARRRMLAKVILHLRQ